MPPRWRSFASRAAMGTERWRRPLLRRAFRCVAHIHRHRDRPPSQDRVLSTVRLTFQLSCQAWDVTVGDLVSGRASLEGFQGLALVGGFSYGDALGSGNTAASTQMPRSLERRRLGKPRGCSSPFDL